MSGTIRLRLIFVGLTQHLSIDLLADSVQELSNADVPRDGLSSGPSQEPPHDYQAHSFTADGQRRPTLAVRERERPHWFERTPTFQVGVIGNRLAEMRRGLQILLQRSKRTPALRAVLRKLRLDVGAHGRNYFVFVQRLASSSVGNRLKRERRRLSNAPAAVDHDITGRGTILWANGPARECSHLSPNRRRAMRGYGRLPAQNGGHDAAATSRALPRAQRRHS